MMKPTKCYVAGPMTGKPLWNFDAFNKAAATLEADGWEVFNPACHGANPAKGLRDYLAIDLPELLNSHCVFMLPGWQYSRGAVLEAFNAQWLGIPCYDYETRKPIPPDPIFAAAQNIFDVMCEGVKTHPHDSWRDESEDEHIRKSQRHGLTFQLIRDGQQRPDGEEHIRMFHVRAAMALAVVKGNIG